MAMIQGLLLLAAISVGVLANEVPLNKGNVAAELSRVRRNPQQNNMPGFPNFAPPGFDSSHIVSQDTDRNKNSFAQSTIYKSENGYGSSSISVSRSGTTSIKASFISCLLVVFSLLPVTHLFRL
ncbi:uncharacterized protein LOC131690979 [Topomyia yanbarensis]|uniref:uncharacterized protein LOC131690979 n=1 Tax=Topomyia yanbarensis TaxID=2498891 RepID=UPI00273C2D12|nr:uncharacterized protein LOC131690979 [Topomyia yanbarensis]